MCRQLKGYFRYRYYRNRYDSYGEAGRTRKNGSTSKVSYRNYYERESERTRAGSAIRRTSFDYDDILFDTRGDAEAVLDSMNDIISQYGMVSVSDFMIWLMLRTTTIQ